MGYAPIDMIRDELPGDIFEGLKSEFKRFGITSLDNMTKEKYEEFLLSEEFLDPDYKGEFKDLNNLFIDSTPTLLDRLHRTMKDVENGNINLRTEWKDLYLSPIIWERWSKNKQVFQPDPYFTEALLHTAELQVSKQQLMHLPCTTFYIDFENVPMFEPIIGMIVDVIVDDDCAIVTEYLLAEQYIGGKRVFFSFYTGGNFDENNMIKIDYSKLNLNKEYTVSTGKNPNGKLDSVIDRTTVSIFGVQMLSYLSSKEPDVLENPITKNTYRPSKTVKNKFSEIQKWDVGIRFGKTIQTKINEYQNENSNQNSKTGFHNDTTKSRKSPMPHFRCAHWQRYWVGKGRKECEVRWIEPVFVGWKTPEDEATNVIIHKVK